jgi:hypothetical protein
MALLCGVVRAMVSAMVSTLPYHVGGESNQLISRGRATMNKAQYFLHRYATPKHVRVVLALTGLITFALVGGAPSDHSGPGS